MSYNFLDKSGLTYFWGKIKAKFISFTSSNQSVAGTTKTVSKVNPETLYVPNGLIMGGTAQAAGLVTRGICGIGTPDNNGACSKENLYINYDGNNTFNANRQIVSSAGTIGNHLGSNMYQYTLPRGEVVKNWVEAKGYTTNTGTVTSVAVKMNNSTKGTVTTSGTIDLGTVITTVDDELDSSVSATNPVQNWVISSAIDALDGEISATYETIPQIIYSRLNSSTISSATIDSIVNGTYGS